MQWVRLFNQETDPSLCCTVKQYSPFAILSSIIKIHSAPLFSLSLPSVNYQLRHAHGLWKRKQQRLLFCSLTNSQTFAGYKSFSVSVWGLHLSWLGKTTGYNQYYNSVVCEIKMKGLPLSKMYIFAIKSYNGTVWIQLWLWTWCSREDLMLCLSLAESHFALFRFVFFIKTSSTEFNYC